jgi:hypothetical protein
VTNDDFRHTLFGQFTEGNYRMDKAGRAIIPAPHYTTARTTVFKVTKGARPLSLMGLGELLYTISVNSNRVWIDTIAGRISDMVTKKQVPDVAGRGDQFYSALGAMMFDSQVRGNLINDNTVLANYGFGALSAGDSSDLQTIVTKIDTQASAFCDECWITGCFNKVLFWEQGLDLDHPPHTHPLASPRATPPAPMVG